MNLKQTRLVTENVEKLTRFYEYVTGAPATVLGSGYVEFQRSPCEGLAIAGTATVRTWSGRCRTGRQPLRDPRFRGRRRRRRIQAAEEARQRLGATADATAVG